MKKIALAVLCMLVYSFLFSYQSDMLNKELEEVQTPQDSVGLELTGTIQDTLVGRMYMNMAKEMADSSNHKEAVILGNKAIEIYSNTVGEIDSLTARAYILAGISYSDLFVFDTAFVYAEKAINFGNAIFKEQNVISNAGYSLLGSIYYNQKKYEDALTYFDKVLKYELNNYGEKHIKIAESYNNIAAVLAGMGEFKQSLDYYLKAISIRKELNGDLDPGLLAPYANVGITYRKMGDYENAKKYSFKGIELSTSVNGENHISLAYSYFGLANIYTVTGEYLKAEDAYLKAVKIFEEKLGEEHPYVIGAYSNIAVVLHNMGNYSKAIKYNEEVIKKRIKVIGKDDPDLAKSYNNLASLFRENGDYQKALETYQKSLLIRKKALNPNLAEVATSYNNIGVVYKSLKKYDLALEFFNKAYDIRLKKFGQNHESIAYLLGNIGSLYFSMGNMEEALKYDKVSLEVAKKSLGLNHPYVANSYNNLSTHFVLNKDYKSAKSYLDKAINIRKEVLGEEHPKTVKAKIAYAVVLLKSGHNIEAFRLNSDSKNTLGYDKNKDNFEGVSDFKVLEDALKFDVSYYQNEYSKRDDEASYNNVKIAYLELIKLEGYFQKEFTDQKTRQFYISNSFEVFENTIKHLNQSKDTSDQHLIFELFEKTKSKFLAEKLNSNFEISSFQLPESIREKEKNINLNISRFDKNIYDEQFNSESPNDSLISSFGNKLFDEKQKRDSLIAIFNKEYPDYYNLKYKNEIASIDMIRNDLLQQKDEALVEFFVGDSSIFTFVISKSDYEVLQLPLNFPLKELVQQMRSGIYQPFLDKNLSQAQKDSLNNLYVTASYQLYQKLIQPLEKVLDNYSKLIIVPDGVLGYIPFDALLTKPVEDVKNYRNYPYLLNKYQTSISYSATLLQEMKEKKHKQIPKKNFLAVAPSFQSDNTDTLMLASRFIDFSENRSRLGALHFNIPEVQGIQEKIGGDLLIGEEATEEAFVNIAGDYRILHLSTHGKANDQAGDYSFLAFHELKDSLENEWLYNRELYELNLNADMVVLSACETGIGELQRGEGIISLARGFSYAGAKSIITSLWSVNDQQTPELMNGFYDYLKNGDAKDEALRKAKIDYLQSSSNPEPFFWAAFVPIGDMTPIDFDQGMPLWSWGLIGFSIIGLLVFLFRRR